MRERLDLPDLPEYVTIKKAARLLGVSDKRVYALVEAQRLPAARAAHVIMIPLEAVKQFKPKVSGRPRTHTPRWRTSPMEDMPIAVSICVQVCAGQYERVLPTLQAIKQTQELLFPGTCTRYIIECPANANEPGSSLELVLIWRRSAMPDASAREQALEEFRQAFADVLDWETARYREGEVLLHA
jgi:excisionase family DNA binding protein